MKIRNGFVSNSSSSSFVLVGYKFDKKTTAEDIVKKFLKTEGCENWNDSDCYEHLYEMCSDFLDDETYKYLGETIADISSDGDYLENKEIDIEDVIEKVKNKYEHLGLGKVKIFTGTRSC